jgi:hypothetical protein
MLYKHICNSYTLIGTNKYKHKIVHTRLNLYFKQHNLRQNIQQKGSCRTIDCFTTTFRRTKDRLIVLLGGSIKSTNTESKSTVFDFRKSTSF